jgi:hypothetical protein
MPLLSKRPLVVVPNKYHHLDHNGFPAAAYPYDSDYAAGRRLFVGASIDVEKTVVHDARGAEPMAKGKGAFIGTMIRGPVQDLRWAFSAAPVEIEDTIHHRAGVKEGALIAADGFTSRATRAAGAPPVPWEKALAESRAVAIDLWKREHDGEDPAFVAEEQAAKTAGAKPEKEQTP